MNVKRFTARTSRDALNLVRQAFGEDAVVLSTRPSADGVEVLAMAPDSVDQIERLATEAPRAAAPAPRAGRPVQAKAMPARTEAAANPSVKPVSPRLQPAAAAQEVTQDVEQLAMSTLSFQDYVRERMLKRRQAAMQSAPTKDNDALPAAPVSAREAVAQRAAAQSNGTRASHHAPMANTAPHHVPRLSDAVDLGDTLPGTPTVIDSAAPMVAAAAAEARRDQIEMMNELRSMKGLIEERFGALAFMEKLQRAPKQAQLTQKLLDCGFSPALIRKLVDGLPTSGVDETAWATSVLERNVLTNEAEPALDEVGGVYALIGSTGVGKTTSTAKIAAAFAARHGASNLGLITLDAYRVGAHEQLRAYGRILGVPVHTAHDRASLEDLLELLSAKKMVLIDTAGMAQRDTRTRELLEMLSHRSIQKLLVLDASSQGETIDDVIVSWRASQCKGAILSKIDEAMKLGPALDALIRHKLKVMGVANGQRVPEDWHRLSSHALVHRALRGGGASAYRLEASEVHLVFANAGVSRSAAALHA